MAGEVPQQNGAEVLSFTFCFVQAELSIAGLFTSSSIATLWCRWPPERKNEDHGRHRDIQTAAHVASRWRHLSSASCGRQPSYLTWMVPRMEMPGSTTTAGVGTYTG